jgi:crotonobetainyl-CoA:carnitine CoA-transferase CaiB-like acyl-CoA transferase
MSGVLEGIKVIELAAWIAGPGTGAVLADWGAEVIKIEDPVTGDPVRGWRSISGIKVTDVHFWFENYNRNKKSIGLDLRKEQGREILYKLVKATDVFVTNFQYPTLDKLKVNYEILSNLNPRLIYAALSGYGKKGADVDKPGFDISTFWARTGIINKMTYSDRSPLMPPHAIGDTTCGMFAAGAISAALFNREKTGLGQCIDVALFNAGVYVASMDMMPVLYQGTPLPQIDRRNNPNPLENVYLTKDGKWLQVVMIQADKYWTNFCKAMKLEHLANDDKFKDVHVRAVNNQELIALLDPLFVAKTSQEWVQIFQEFGLICAPICAFTDVVNDPQALANNFFAEIDHPVGKKVKLVNTPVQFSRTPAQVKTPAPELGQHTEEILLDSGYSRDEVAYFKEKGIIT